MRLLAPPSLLRPRLRRLARTALAATAVFAGGACSGGDGDTGVEPTSVVGSYALVSFEGEPVPVTRTGGGFRSELLGGRLEFRGDQTFDIALDIRDTDLADGTVETSSEVSTGRYTVRGTTVTFANTTDGALDGSQAFVRDERVTLGPFVFSR